MTKLLYLAAVLAVATLADAVDYCGLESCGSHQHTMCAFTSPDVSSRCNSHEVASLTVDQQKQILDTHNNLRSAAGNPEPMKWDDELAEIAQRWANQCNVSLDACRDVERFQVGQNIIIVAYDNEYKTDLSSLVRMWFKHVRYSGQSQPQSASPKPTLVSRPAAVKPHVVVPAAVVQPVYPHRPVQWLYPQKPVQQVYPQQPVQWVYPQQPVQWVYPLQPVQWVYPVRAKASSPSGSLFHFETSYSQLASGVATNVGCGLVKYREHSWYATYLVCNYGPARN